MKLLKSTQISTAVLVLLMATLRVTQSMKVKFTNLQCNVSDAAFGSVQKCILKAQARDVVSLHLNVQLHQLPLSNITINVELFQMGNGFRPFMYNTTMDLCQFIQKPYRYMFWKIAYDSAKPYMNFNHSCPFDHDLIIDKWILNADMFKLVPFPSNDYMIQVQLANYNVYKVQVKMYFKIYE